MPGQRNNGLAILFLGCVAFLGIAAAEDIFMENNDGTTNAVVDVVNITKDTTGTPANGIGVGLTFDVEDLGGSEQQGSIDVFLEDVTNGSEDATMAFSINQGGTISEILRLDGTSGFVGVGTTAPGSALHVDSGAANTTCVITVESTSGDFDIFVTGATPESVITGNPGDLAVDQSGGGIYVKSSGTGNTGWTSLTAGGSVDLMPFCAYDTTGGQAVTTSAVTLNIDTVAVSDANYTLSTDVITFNSTGTYQVTVDATFVEQNSGGDRYGVIATVQEDTGGGFTDIVYAIACSYQRKTANRATASQTWIRTFNSGDDIRVQVAGTSGTATPLDIDTAADASRISILKLE